MQGHLGQRFITWISYDSHAADHEPRKDVNRITAHDPEARSADVVAGNVRRLKAVFPEAFTEGKIDFGMLKQLLGDQVDEREERYGLDWHGKRRARQLALTPSTGTLRPCPEESVDWETTRNLMIEGDNLEVLKLLQKSYAGKVKLIYIDPPYNTGKDFVYPDDFRDGIRNYLDLTGQTDGENRRLSSNTETSGRFHTDWLNMMYLRLKIARDFLTNDGIIFISIGDEEVHHLRLMCGDVFGYENFCGAFVWEKKKKPSFLDRNMGTVTDYIVSYAKDRSQSPAFTAGAVEEGKKYPFNNAGNNMAVLEFPAGSVTFHLGDRVVTAQDMSEGNIRTDLLDDVCIVNGRNRDKFRLRGEWRYSQSKLDRLIADGGDILISKVPFRPNYVNRSGERKKTANLLSYRVNAIQTNEDATQQARGIFGGDVVSYPKPEGLLKYLVRAVSQGDDVILDFFTGSGTTASGVWRQNVEDSCSRRFILVQLPQSLDMEGKTQAAAADFCDRIGRPRNLAELTKERLRRSARQFKEETSLFTGDLGFRVCKLDTSNIRTWEPDHDDLDGTLLDSVDHVKADRSEEDVLYELLLKLGLDLCLPIETRIIAGKSVRSVGGGTLITCLDPRIAKEEVEPLAVGISDWCGEMEAASESTIIFRDSAFTDDIAKINLAAVLGQRGFGNLRSL